jgi:hypothetical protein
LSYHQDLHRSIGAGTGWCGFDTSSACSRDRCNTKHLSHQAERLSSAKGAHAPRVLAQGGRHPTAGNRVLQVRRRDLCDRTSDKASTHTQHRLHRRPRGRDHPATRAARILSSGECSRSCSTPSRLPRRLSSSTTWC